MHIIKMKELLLHITWMNLHWTGKFFSGKQGIYKIVCRKCVSTLCLILEPKQLMHSY